MPVVIGTAFKPIGKIHYCDPGDLAVSVHDNVVVDTTQGAQFGFVKIGPRAIPDAEIVPPLQRVLRLATPQDYSRYERCERKQAEAVLACKDKVRSLGLPMKLIECDWAFDDSQVTFHFVAEGRVDFRELVREVAGILHTRVMMHQVGPREHAKVITGIGPCGRPTCCSTFLREFEPVSMKMAKGQNLALNPTKFSGLCGKLMCCLRYEQDQTEPGAVLLPQVGMVVMTPLGRAKVEEVSALHQMATVQLESGRFVEVRAKDIGEVPNCVDHAEGGCTDCAATGVLDNCGVPARDKTPSGPLLPLL
ncbi:MAG: stage 0 sporulation family protein [Capsulimonadaceae bacterium]